MAEKEYYLEIHPDEWAKIPVGYTVVIGGALRSDELYPCCPICGSINAEFTVDAVMECTRDASLGAVPMWECKQRNIHVKCGCGYSYIEVRK